MAPQEWADLRRQHEARSSRTGRSSTSRDSDPIFHTIYDLDDRYQVPGAQYLHTGGPMRKTAIEPRWRGIYDDKGRLMVAICHNMDLGDSWEWADDPRVSREVFGAGHSDRRELRHLFDDALVMSLSLKIRRDSALQVNGVPEHDGGDHQISPLARCLWFLCVRSRSSPQPVEEHRPGQCLFCFAFIEPDVDAPPQFDAADVLEQEQRPFNLAEFSQCSR